tara:strand:+ start:78 stop:431 length:354 start_codon:yes stop_codon:yes gene_type:complete
MFKSKIGAAKQKPLSRVWLEGKRLTEAGFHAGTMYHREYYNTGTYNRLILWIDSGRDQSAGSYKVSGKNQKPVIDITGAMIRDNFGKYAPHVHVYYDFGRITIMRGDDSRDPYQDEL